MSSVIWWYKKITKKRYPSLMKFIIHDIDDNPWLYRCFCIPDQQNQNGTQHFPPCHLNLAVTKMDQKPLHWPGRHPLKDNHEGYNHAYEIMTSRHLIEHLPKSCVPHPMPQPSDLPYSKLELDHPHLQSKYIFHPRCSASFCCLLYHSLFKGSNNILQKEKELEEMISCTIYIYIF